MENAPYNVSKAKETNGFLSASEEACSQKPKGVADKKKFKIIQKFKNQYHLVIGLLHLQISIRVCMSLKKYNFQAMEMGSVFILMLQECCKVTID